MESIENRIYKRICGKGHLWSFTDRDFWDMGSRGAVRIALVRLVEKGKIRRVIRGLYDYPKFSEMLNTQLGTDLHQAAQALTRKFSWQIQPSENVALNVLGISTQVPGRAVYYSNGPSREYQIGNRELIFKKTALKHTNFKYPQSGLVVQALEGLTKDRVDDRVMRKIRDNFDKSTLQKILSDTRSVKGWVYDCIREICLEDANG